MNLEIGRLFVNKHIYVATSDIHRWGVFSKKKLKAWDVIQEFPYCTFGEDELENAPTVERYTYGAGYLAEVDEVVLGFGFAPLFNHSDEPNVAYLLDPVNEVMRHYALCDIDAHEELVIDYGFEEGEEVDWGDY